MTYSRLAFLVEWATAKGGKILLILIVSYILFRLVGVLINRTVKLITKDRLSQTQLAQRAKTLAGVLRGVARFGIFFTALLMVLREVGVDPTPILAGAGIVGLAVSFGAQNLVRDMINGFFILFENHFGVGDSVEVGTSKGKVVHMNLRITQLRDVGGSLHTIPNGEIRKVVNYSREWVQAVVDINVSSKQDVEQVLSVIREECEKFYADKNFRSKMLEKPQVLGVQDLGASGMTLRTTVKTKPAAQGDIERELRKRLKKRFDIEKIEMPFP